MKLKKLDSVNFQTLENNKMKNITGGGHYIWVVTWMTTGAWMADRVWVDAGGDIIDMAEGGVEGAV